MPQIHFNGKTYNDLAEMPATERAKYDQLMAVMRDENGNGMPDIFEGDVIGNIIEMVKKSGYDDSEGISTLEQMSPAMRARISKGVAKLYELGLISEMPDLPSDAPVSSWTDSEIRPSQPVIQSPSAIQEESISRLWVILLLAVIIGISLFGVVYYLAQ